VLLLCAMPLTLLEFPIWFGELLGSQVEAVLALGLRNALLVAATVVSGRRLWRASRGVEDAVVVEAPQAAAVGADRRPAETSA
jgi:hypothetical protein